jgi:NADH-quinone oxidoreductase subunit G
LNLLGQALKKGQLDTLIVVGEDLMDAKVDAELLSDVQIIYLGTHDNATSTLAQVVIPTLTPFEKSGSFVNRSFFLQGFQQSVPGPAGLLPDVSILARLINELNGEAELGSDLSAIWKMMARSSTSPLKGLSFSDFKKDGIKLDGSKWDELPFAEQKALHYEPIADLTTD